jgi:o-succinylbenzoate synthase
MAALSLRSYLYSLSLVSPYPARKGIVIEWPDGRWSEASPLDGWSSDRLDDVVHALQACRYEADLPSLQFAMQPFPLIPLALPFCALLAGSKEAILAKIPSLLQEGVRHIKLKCKGLSLDEAASITQKLSKEGFSIRIDWNRSLSLSDALAFAKQCPCESIDFFEEPLKNSRELADFPFPIALDESLREENYEPLVALPQVKALVIKPTMNGGLKHWQRFGKPIVLSSSFESGIGIVQILLLAAHHQITLPLGIDTYRLLKEDLLEEPLVFKEGAVYLPSTLQIKRHLLRSC